jgi:membrane-bound lytic murein transglycosylase D
MYLTPDANCNYRDENPEFSDATYIDRLRRMPNIMEMPYNQVVRKFIDRYASRMRRAVGYWLGASNFYMPIFEQALEAYNMPLELRYLPVIESGLNPNAISRVGATGLWQFMLATGKSYGLKVNSLVDERRDPIKASYAAAHYLSDLYKIFGDWNLVIAAYNCGPENINRAIHRAGGERDYWKIYPYLPRETRGYVPAFIAANYIMNYYCEHNICPMRTQLPAKSDTIIVNRDVHLKQVAAICDLSLEELRTLNPQYRRDIVNGSTEPSAIRLPDAAINTFIDNEDSVYVYNADQLLSRRAEVFVSDAQPEVARSVAPSYSSRRSFSRHDRRGHNRQERAVKGRKGRKERKVREQNVTIKEGQTLSQIARKNHTTVDKLRKLNGIKGSNIRAGKKLRVK